MNIAYTDYYKLLEISADANSKVIRKAWRLKSKEVHPDINASPSSTADFRALTLALKILTDPVERLKHDRQFGYLNQFNNNNEFVIQTFSNEQNEKAKLTVLEWSSDYQISMAIREAQRNKNITIHKRNIRYIKIILALALAFLLVGIIVFIFY